MRVESISMCTDTYKDRDDIYNVECQLTLGKYLGLPLAIFTLWGPSSVLQRHGYVKPVLKPPLRHNPACVKRLNTAFSERAS